MCVSVEGRRVVFILYTGEVNMDFGGRNGIFILGLVVCFVSSKSPLFHGLDLTESVSVC